MSLSYHWYHLSYGLPSMYVSSHDITKVGIHSAEVFIIKKLNRKFEMILWFPNRLYKDPSLILTAECMLPSLALSLCPLTVHARKWRQRGAKLTGSFSDLSEISQNSNFLVKMEIFQFRVTQS